MGEKGQSLHRVLVARGKDASEDLLSASTGPCSVAAEDLAIDHRGAHGLLRRPVGGLDVRMIEEGENLIPVPGEVRLKSSVAFMRKPRFQQSIQSFLQSPPRYRQPRSTDFPRIAPAAKVQGIVQELPDLSRESPRSTR